MSYHIEVPRFGFKELPDRILVREDGAYGASKEHGEPIIDHWYVPEQNASQAALERRIDELCAEVERGKAEFKKMDVWHSQELKAAMDENAKLRERIERLQPTDSDGNVLDIADTVHMLRSEYDGDHEWDDVIVELTLTKWGGDRWIVRGSKGEAWACDCTKTGYDEDAFEDSDDVEPFDDATLTEVENAKLREYAAMAWGLFIRHGAVHACDLSEVDAVRDGLRKLGIEVEK